MSSTERSVRLGFLRVVKIVIFLILSSQRPYPVSEILANAMATDVDDSLFTYAINSSTSSPAGLFSNWDVSINP